MRHAALIVLLAAPAAAQDPVFSPEATAACEAAAGGGMAARGCIGASAEACIGTSAPGSTTVGMGFCFERELSVWDRRLNAAYQSLMAAERARDAAAARLGAPAPPLADALRAMQRAWIPFRDARCDYARAQWGGGTGAGPATLACLMRMTGEQALELEAELAGQGLP
jgi:uncharacterized protein YecT (DUF1311 family)